MSEPVVHPETADLSELSCVSCRYDLRGLPAEGACPECGTALRVTRRARRSPLADPAWVRATRRGLTSLIVAGSISLAITVLQFTPLLSAALTPSPIPAWVIPLLVALTVYLHLADASVLLTRREPGRVSFQPEGVRRFTRLVLLTFILVGFAREVDWATGMAFSDRFIWSIPYAYLLWDWAPGALFIVGAFFLLWRLRQLAALAQRPRLARQLQWLQWLLPLYTLSFEALLRAPAYGETMDWIFWALPFLVAPEAVLHLWAMIFLFLLRRRLGQVRREHTTEQNP